MFLLLNFLLFILDFEVRYLHVIYFYYMLQKKTSNSIIDKLIKLITFKFNNQKKKA